MKPRPDNVLANLPEPQLEQLHQWIDARHTQAKIVALLAEQFGVRTHKNSVGRYSERLAAEERNLDASVSIESLKNAEPEEFDRAAVAGLKYKLYKLATSPDADTLEFARLFRLRLRMKDQELARDRFECNVAEIALKHASALRDIAHDSTLETKEKRRAARLELFGVLTNQEEPITHEEWNRNPVADNSQNLVAAEANGSRLEAESPVPANVPSENLSTGLKFAISEPRIMDQPSPVSQSATLLYRRLPTGPAQDDSTIGEAIIKSPEKPSQPARSFSDSYFDTSEAETPFTPDDTRDYKVKHDRDYFGEYLQYEYRDGNNPQGDTKYIMDRNNFTIKRRKEQ